MALDAMTRTRIETDSLGSLEIPADAYWGIHTARALENFPISKRPISVYQDLVRALAMVKQASARANREIGALDPEKADLIDRASQLVIDGQFHDQFVVGVIQGGAGTSTNMNANEVITNIALELAGREKGDYAFLSPIDDTNRSQSTNDVYPTAIKVGLGLDLLTLLEELDLLRRAFLAKAVEFHDVLKVGRTQLQDAVPMTLGQEFHGFATTLGEDYSRLKENAYLLYEINMGATAIGTGITTHPDYAGRCCGTCARSAGSTSRRRPTWSSRRATRARSCRSRRRSSATRSSCRRSATTCGCCRRARRRASARSTCPPARQGRASCPARSTR